MRLIGAVVPLLLIASAGVASAGTKPNFLIIITDDHGYGDVSTYHASDVRTPHIDRLAAEGMLFTAMRANATVCSPSRAVLLTGRYPDRVGVPGVIRTDPGDSWGYLDPAVPTPAGERRRAGPVPWQAPRWGPPHRRETRSAEPLDQRRRRPLADAGHPHNPRQVGGPSTTKVGSGGPTSI
ncbi:MAG: sulfatase-like hydrolase/transferase [Vicinamibacterales bacterium]|jgi:hypothetical protein|nr:sulfatase-like hydrolase/transferase [Vicinamibacterales bacterium]MCU0295852.1 sulfatase-like hydrolase/transferase [Candidatus Nanopelagicales bacterium]